MSKPIIDCLPTGTILHGEAYEYEIIKALGQGAFGITYLAEVQLRGKLGMVTTKVAIKEFFMHEINGRDRDKTTVTSGNRVGIYDKYKRKFISEARNLSKLSRSKHNHIINVLEAFEANNTVYYSMDYIEDGSLDDLIQKKGCLGVDETLQYTSQIASALSFMHLQNMLHLDVKPSNIMLRNGSAVLIDFGLSKQYNEDGFPESSTTIGAGTPGYAPLEQVNYQESSEEGLPVTMDIYALGATMFKMLTGHTPPPASHVLNYGLPLGELREKGVDANIVRLITRCMAPICRDRYQNVRDFQADLKRVYSTPEEETDFDKGKEKSDKKKDNHGQSGRTPQPPLWMKIALFGVVLALIIGGVGGFLYYNYNKGQDFDIFTELSYDDMVHVEGGTFLMGAHKEDPDAPNYDSEAFDWESPVHSVTVSSFYMGKYEVTQGFWEYVMNYSGIASDGSTMAPYAADVWPGDNPNSTYGKGDNYPAYYVSYDDIVDIFLPRLNKITGKTFRLPTEAEWEYAARGGNRSKGYKYSGRNDISNVAWYGENTSDKTHSVGNKKANELGIYDMSGNVWEWCSDWCGKYSLDTQTNPTGPSSGSNRVLRGGGWFNNERYCRTSYRNIFNFETRTYGIGFRLVYQENKDSLSASHTAVDSIVACGSLEITTTPADVEIYINGKSYGKSPTTIDNLALGSYKVELRKKGYITETKQVSIKYNNQTISLDRSLQEEPKVETVVNKTVEKPRQQNPEIEKLLNNMVYVAGGTFLMGAQRTDPNAPNYDSGAYDNESPVHSVTVSSFYMGKYEVTQGQWEAVMSYSGTAADGTQMSSYAADVWLGSNPSSEYGKGANYPAYDVSYNDIVDIFLPRLNKITGKEFRLPTEAEWEYAARGGNKSRGYKYSGSNTIGDVAWYDGNSSSTHPVGSTQLRPNELGLYDMSGNVWEWCSDYWSRDYNSTPSGPYRVNRGGSWYYYAKDCRVSDRYYGDPDCRHFILGFRLVRR